MITLSYAVLGANFLLVGFLICVVIYYCRQYSQIKFEIPILQLKLDQSATRLQQAKQQAEIQLQNIKDQSDERLHLLNEKLKEHQNILTQFNERNMENAALNQKLSLFAYYENRSAVLEKELSALNSKYTHQYAELSELKTRLEEIRLASDEKMQLLTQSEERLTQQFENVANRIFSHNNKQMEAQNSERLHLLLNPLKNELESFRKQVQESFTADAKERHILTHEIQQLHQLNQQMTQEAINLTTALKGNNKIQGNWGEVILNKILESSGLREGHEYETQVSLQNDVGKRQQPDVIVHLPQSKDIIIDAKMTLIAYERYFNSHNDEEKQTALRDHISAFKQHIKQLSDKHYSKLEGLNSLDYILMFIPVEPAYLVAIDHEPSLIDEALRNNILLVSPTTLLAALRTISTLWGYENRNRYAQEIAEKAAKLYDKMRGFIEDMENLGTHLRRSEKVYTEALGKLVRGKGNILGQIEQFRHRGINVKKIISESLAKTALEECGENESTVEQATETE